MRIRPPSADRSASSDLLLSAAVVAALAAAASAQQRFAEAPRPGFHGNTYTSAIVTGDFDGDGDLDVLVGSRRFSGYYNCYGTTMSLLSNDGWGRFVPAAAGALPTDNDPTGALAVGDVDGDGDLDIIKGTGGYSCGGGTRQTRLFANNGAGVFTDQTATHLPVDSEWTHDAVLADFDGDGDLDLFLANELGPNRLYRNDGSGVFGDATGNLPTSTDPSTSCAAGDVDGDGDVDLVIGGWGGVQLQVRLYRNDGSGVFVDATAVNVPASPEPSQIVALGDVDGDGDLDLVACGGPSYGSNQNRLLRNDGTGAFVEATATHLPADNDPTSAVLFWDVDDDGDLDLLFGNSGFCPASTGNTTYCYGRQNTLLLNDGAGMFQDGSSQLPSDGYVTRALAVGDIDGDGDVDLVEGNELGNNYAYQYFDGSDRIYRNLERQLLAPVTPQIGKPYPLDAYARWMPQSSGDLAAIYLSTAPASIAMQPFGTVGIDPSLATPLPLLLIPQPAGMASAGFTLPFEASLIGQPLYAQAMMVTGGGELRLSNRVADIVAPPDMPQITSVTPAQAAPGTVVTVQGRDFLPGLVLTVDGTSVPVASMTWSMLTFVAPANIGCDVTIEVANVGTESAVETINRSPWAIFWQTAPVGPAAGGAPVEFLGSGLQGTTVTFNGVPMNVTSQTSNSILGTTPPGAIGPATVRITNPIGCSVTLSYTYQ